MTTRATHAIPPPPAAFVGRDAPLARLQVGLERVSVALICGVAGVGKSSLACAFAASWPGPVAYCRTAAEPTLAVLCEDVLRQLGAAAGDPAAVAHELDERGALWVIDDLHRLAADDRARLVRELGQRLRAGKLIATSRELLPFEADGPDRLEVKLGGLDAASAQTLWSALDGLHGEAPGFEAAWARARGNPLLLRQGHACRPVAEDHVAAAVRALASGERRVATALALCELALPTRTVHALAGAAGPAALDGLVTRMIVDPAGAGAWQLHDLFREALLAELPAEVAGELHDELARRVAEAEVDPVLRVREATRHLRALGRDADAAAYLIAEEPVLLRGGATGELLRGLEALSLGERERAGWTIAAVTLARTRARMLDLERAQRELERLVARGAASSEAWLVLGQVALLRGELAIAADALARAGDAGDAPPMVRQLILVSAAIVDAHRGRGAEALARLAAAERAADDPDEAGTLLLMRGFVLYLDEVDDELEAILASGQFYTGCIAALRANVVAPGLAAALCARLGRFDAAEEHYTRAVAALGRDDDLLSRVTLAFTRAAIDFERGERVAAEHRLGELAAVMVQRGHVMGALMCDALRARVLSVLGRRRAAAALAGAAAERAARLGVASIANQVARARQHDVVAQLAGATAERAARPGRAVDLRARALEAVRAAAAGDAAAAVAIGAADAPRVAGPGYGVERALARIAHALVARLDGREPDALRELDRAAALLDEDGADRDLVADLVAAAGTVRAITPRARRLVSPARADELAAAVIADARRAEIRSGATVVSMRHRPALGKLFFALASRPGASWSKDALVELVWGASYNPLVHDNSLKVSVTRLRALLGPQMSLDFDGEGYRLEVPDQFLYLDAPGGNPE